MRGRTDYDGQVQWDSDKYHGMKNFLEEIDEKYWCIRYDDESVPAISDIELSNGEHKSLDQDEINTFSVLAERLWNEAENAVQEQEAELQRLDDEDYMRNYITWTIRAKKSRDEMLASSDPSLRADGQLRYLLTPFDRTVGFLAFTFAHDHVAAI